MSGHRRPIEIARTAIRSANLMVPPGATWEERLAAVEAAYPFAGREGTIGHIWRKQVRRLLAPYNPGKPRK